MRAVIRVCSAYRTTSTYVTVTQFIVMLLWARHKLEIVFGTWLCCVNPLTLQHGQTGSAVTYSTTWFTVHSVILNACGWVCRNMGYWCYSSGLSFATLRNASYTYVLWCISFTSPASALEVWSPRFKNVITDGTKAGWNKRLWKLLTT